MLQRLEAVDAVAEAPWHCNDLTLNHGCIIGQEEDQLATCHASDPTRSEHGSEHGSKGAQLVRGVSNELLLRDGSNSATNMEQARLDELGRHLLDELGGHLFVDDGVVQLAPRRCVRQVERHRTGAAARHSILSMSWLGANR